MSNVLTEIKQPIDRCKLKTDGDICSSPDNHGRDCCLNNCPFISSRTRADIQSIIGYSKTLETIVIETCNVLSGENPDVATITHKLRRIIEG